MACGRKRTLPLGRPLRPSVLRLFIILLLFSGQYLLLSFLQYFHVTGRKRTGRCFSTSYDAFTKVFRRHLATIGVRNPSEYSSKAFRRGTAMELLKQGGRLGDILEAGQWRSPAFLQYMLRADIDELAVFDMIVAQEDKLPKRQ